MHTGWIHFEIDEVAPGMGNCPTGRETRLSVSSQSRVLQRIWIMSLVCELMFPEDDAHRRVKGEPWRAVLMSENYFGAP